MRYAEVNDKLMELVRAYHKAKLPHLAGELYAVFPVETPQDLHSALDRIHSIQALLRLCPEPKAPSLYGLEIEILNEMEPEEETL